MARSRRGQPGSRRRSPYRRVRKRFLLYCEGTATEPGYFEYVRDQLRDALIVLKWEAGGSPLQLVRTAVAERDRARAEARRERDDNVAWDEVWCVVDVDQHADLRDAVTLAQREGIRMAVSNPCFELWPLLHFADQRAHVEGDDVQRSLRQHLPGSGKRLDCRKLEGRYGDAKLRAGTLRDQHRRNGREGANPSTDVVLLIEAVLAAARASARDPNQYDDAL